MRRTALTKNLDKLQPKDDLVIFHHWGYTAHVVKVERNQKTQIVAGGVKYRKDTGFAVEQHCPYGIAHNEDGTLMTPHEAVIHCNSLSDDQRKRELMMDIVAVAYTGNWDNFTLEQLQNAAKALGIDVNMSP